MRLKLVLKIVEGTVVPCNYMYELSSCLYKVLNEGNPVFTAWLHDKGYCKEKKAFKLFVIVKTCSDSLFSIGQKNCQLFVAKLRNFLDSHNRMVLY